MIGKEVLNYTIVSLIGKGGMGSVYLAEHKYIKQQKVAIKVINSDMVNDFTRQRLKEEAEHLASLNHQNIVRFHDYHIDELGSIYLIMEYADGISLDKYIQTVSGLIVEDKICPLFEPILDAVEYAHEHNIIHRDIKPANIIITKEGIPKILDFGIATIINRESVEKDDMVMGTPSYMSPEQVRGDHLDSRSDIYSLGVMLHQMLTGNAPYDTTTLTEYDINKKVVEEPLPRMRTYYKYVSDKVQKIVDKATAKEPGERYQTCDDFKKALHRVIYPPKIPKWVWTSVAAIVLLMIGGGVYFWDYNRTKVYYYKDYVEQWGVPQGIGELSSREMSHVNRLYRFEYKKHKLQRMSHVNSKENIIEDGESERNERPLDMLLYYTDKGNISRAKVLDRSGKVLYVKSYNDKLNTVIFQYDDEYGTEKTLGAQTIGYVRALEDNGVEKGKISRWLLEYDENGYVSTIRYAGFQNVLVGDAHNIYGRKYVRDEKGRVLSEHYLSFDGTPKATKWGLGMKKFYYDENDNWVKAEYLTVDGKPAYDDADGIGVYVMEYDKYGNVVYALHQDADGKLMLPKKNGVAGIKYIYDQHGFPIEASYLDIDRKACFIPNDGFSKVVRKFDDNGYIINQTFYDVDGNQCLSNDGNSSAKYINDNRGNVQEMWFYGLDGKLNEINEGYAGVKLNYDSIGNIIEYVTYGIDQKPCLKSDGTAGYKAEYNDMNLITKLVNIGVDLSPCKDNNGIVIAARDYDKRGNQIKVSFYDAGGKTLVLSNENIAGWNSVYDDNGNETERSFFDDKNNLTVCAGSCAKWISKFDEQGNETNLRYYNLSGKLMMVNGSAGANYKRDKRGNILEKIEIGTDEQLASGKLIARYKYDKFDNQIEFSVYDRNNKPALNSLDYHKYVCIYNSRNQRIEIEYYGKDGELTSYNNDKYAIQKDEYDERGYIVRTSYYGKDKQLVVSNEGWASSTREYDVLGNVLKQSFFGIDGKPTDPKVMVPEGLCRYDRWGNRVYLAAGDGKGHLIINPKTGWSIQKSEYNSRGKLLSEAYFDENEKPLISRMDGYHKAVISYTSSGNEKEKCYYDIMNKPMLCPDGYFKEVYEYNDNQQAISLSYLGVNGKSIDCKDGYSKIELTYNKDGEMESRKYTNASGRILLTQKWNGKEWVNSSPEPISRNWQQDVRKFNAELPIDFGENTKHLVASSFLVTGSNSCELSFKTPKSKYEMTEAEVNEYFASIKLVVTKIKSESLPSSVVITGILFDSKGRQLRSIRK